MSCGIKFLLSIQVIGQFEIFSLQPYWLEGPKAN